jgi:hypothetical protein
MLENFESHLARMRRALGTRPGVSLCEIEYAGVLRDPRGAAERMARFLERPLDVDAMVQAVDPNLYRNRNPRS